MRRRNGAGDTWIVRTLGEHFVPRQRIGRQFAGISLFGAFGSGMYYSCSALYFTTVVGLSVGQVGAGLSIGAIAGLVGGVPVGMLADRLRVGHVYIWLQVLRGFVFTAFCLVDTFPGFAGACVVAPRVLCARPCWRVRYRWRRYCLRLRLLGGGGRRTSAMGGRACVARR